MKKIGFFSFRIPYPLVSGGHIRSYYLLKKLSEEFEVTLFTFYKNKKELEGLEHLSFCKNIYTFPRRQLNNPLNVVFMMKGLPFASALYYDRASRRRFEELVKKEKLEAVHFESYYPATYMYSNIDCVKIFGTENLEYRVYERFVNSQYQPLKSLLRLEIGRMRRYEEKLFKSADYNLAVSESEKTEIERVTGEECYLIPNGVDTDSFNFEKESTKIPTLLYIGNSKYFQNREAIKKILTEIYPKVSRKIKLLIVSANATSEARDIARLNPDITIDTELVDVREAFKKADIMLVPVTMAGGTRIKILESFASRVAVISTSIGIAGIEAEKDKHYLEANTMSEFVDTINHLLDRRDQLDIITKHALTFVKNTYSWEKISTDLVSLYHNKFLSRRKTT